MTNPIFPVLAMALLTFSMPAFAQEPAGATTLDPRVATARATVKKHAGDLKKHLKAALKTGGPIHALPVCKTIAPALADAQSKSGPMSIRRTALKLRNPANAPDDFERRTMEMFTEKLNAGEPAATMEYWEVVTTNGKKQFRYMKAIPTHKKPCLACHGTNLKPKLQARITELYPTDQATGFKAGELRGAFSLSQPVK